MVNRNLIREFDITEDEELAAIGTPRRRRRWLAGADVANQIVEGRVIRIDEDFILVDVGYKTKASSPQRMGKGDELPRSATRSRPRRRHRRHRGSMTIPE